MSQSRDSNLIIRQYREGDERAIAEVLNKSHAGGWGVVEDWRWKYTNCMNFDSECIYVTEENANVVGCWHAIVHDLQCGESLVRIALEGDLAVLPDHRGTGSVIRLYDALNETLLRKNVVARVGITSPELMSGFYSRLFGYFHFPVVGYMKVFSYRFFEDKIAKINERLKTNPSLSRELEVLSLTIQCHLRDIPPFLLKVAGGKFVLEGGEASVPDVIISGDQGPVLEAMGGKSRGGSKVSLCQSLLTGRVRVHGLVGKNLMKLYKIFKIMTKLRD